MIGFYRSNAYGVIEASGADTSDLLQRLTTNDVSTIMPGGGIRTVLLTEKGRIVDVLTLLNRGTHWTIVTSPGCLNSVFHWIRRYIIMDDVRLTLPTEMESIEVWARENYVLAKLIPTLEAREGSWVHTKLGDIPVTAIRLWTAHACSTTRGEMVLVQYESSLRNALLDWFASCGAQEITSEERTSLRIQFRIGQFPNEYNDAYTPLESGLTHLVALGKGCFIGQEVLERLAVQQKLRWRLYAIETPDGMLFEGDHLIPHPQVAGDIQHERAGIITSVAVGSKGHPTKALAYIRRDAPSQLQTERGVNIHIVEPIGNTIS